MPIALTRRLGRCFYGFRWFFEPFSSGSPKCKHAVLTGIFEFSNKIRKSRKV